MHGHDWTVDDKGATYAPETTRVVLRWSPASGRNLVVTELAKLVEDAAAAAQRVDHQPRVTRVGGSLRLRSGHVDA